MRLDSISITPGQRFAVGVIASFDNGETRHFGGDGTDAIRAAADYCDERGCKILALSNPRTVYRDLQGTRSHGTRVVDSPFWAAPVDDDMHFPETKMLGRIDRLDLIA